MLPRVVIVGRPNVGKSSLLNMLAGRKISIVDPTAGVTRDRIGATVELPRKHRNGEPRVIEVIDTGGYGIEDSQKLTADVERQIALGVADADLVLFVVDGQAGIMPLDEQVARLLRKSATKTPILFVANKVDADSQEAAAFNVMSLGLGEPVMVSAITKHRIYGLYDALNDALPDELFDPRESIGNPGILLAIVGKRNAGKSTMVNALAGSERVIVSEVEGTTRDSVDVRIEVELADEDLAHIEQLEEIEQGVLEEENKQPKWPDEDEAIDDEAGLDDAEFEDGDKDFDEASLYEDSNLPPLDGNDGFVDPLDDNDGLNDEARDHDGEPVSPMTEDGKLIFTLIDTAGMRKRKSVKDDIEYYSMHRSLRSIRRADVVVHVIDASLKVSNVDQQLASELMRHERPVVLVINKWDTVDPTLDDMDMQEKFAEYLEKELKPVRFAPIVFTSALNEDGVREVIAVAESLYRQSRARMTTGALNQLITDIQKERKPRGKSGNEGKVFFASQPAVDPPTIVMQVNDSTLFDNNYQLFLLNRLRDHVPFSEVPIRLKFKGKEGRYKNKK